MAPGDDAAGRFDAEDDAFESLMAAAPADGAQAQVEADARGDDGGGVWPFLGLPLPVDAPGIRPSSLAVMRVIAEATCVDVA